MKNGYEILWTNNALKELAQTFEYLELNFSEKELRKLSTEIERILRLISQNPTLFSLLDSRNVRKVVILKYNSMYYRVNGDAIEILSFFSNRQSPQKNKI